MTKLILNADVQRGQINKNIYGHFSEHLGRCIYGGIYVGEDSDIPNIDGMRTDVIEALKAMKIPVLRWPGGCFADEYHWEDGIGPKEKRPCMVNTHWGGVTEDNSFGTHEFLRFCELIETEPYINGNVGSGTVREMQQWVEYMTFDGISPMSNLRKENGREEPWKIKYFAMGNETWGCGGNMRAEYYADEYRRYGTYVRNFGDNKIYKIAVGPNTDDYHWMEVMMSRAGKYMDGITLHYYTTPGAWENKTPARGFDKAEWYCTMKKTQYMEELVTRHSAIMDQYDPDKRVGLLVDEWGTWHKCEEGTNPGFLYQQNTLRDALVAGLNLNIFNNHCDRVQMANIAQLVNVLQSVILTEGEKMILTPTYHVFCMYQGHQDAQLVDAALMNVPTVEGMDAVTVSASVKDGKMLVTLCNIDADHSVPMELDLRGAQYSKATATVLTGEVLDEHNDFDAPDRIVPVDLACELKGQTCCVTLPAKSVTAIVLE
ncbi:MAG: alpha-N-arabinofuranosidase [Firmicutes bacterium]|nr:alpha-N-arabinofuranosidase [Bacillota bacterium]